ncbi:MAG: ribosome-binding factor A [Deltaproteobacteria bacterium RIFCSPLOWO2_02_FULL_44_10]|nr:MAG: ribosome-binding factor A [Deltaproteobacteria bacterium RIFCSPHIGHO2_02_FULL_44_16]OGQ45895.1 MAG: ribosome-binding factor A [Deltaproteobacteria bacterium RIFCSPLOWO2_02_FULL_44_10]
MKQSKQLPFDRAERVAEQVFHVVTTACQYELSDPRIDGVRITRVKMTKDLRIVRIYFYVLQEQQHRRDEIESGLKNASGFLKHLINNSVKLKFVPEVEIFFDDILAQEERVHHLLDAAEGV